MIVIDKIDEESKFIDKLFTICKLRVYVHQDLRKKNNQKYQGIKKIFFTQEDNINCYNLFDFPKKNLVKNFCNEIIPKTLILSVKEFFPNISKIDQKIEACLASMLNYHNIGTINYFAFQNSSKKEKVYLIHSNLFSFLLQNNGTKEFRKTYHFYLPIDILKFIKTVLNKICKIKIILKKYKISRQYNCKFKKIGVIYHRDLTYGSLYKKTHLISEDKRSPLNIKNLKLYTLFSTKSLKFKKTNINNLSYKYAINKKMLLVFWKLCRHIKDFKTFSGAAVIFAIFFQYQNWLNRMTKEPLKAVIMDYDILFPRPLSLALESLKIPTIGIQERPAASFYHCLYRVIADCYFFAGKLYEQFAQETKSVIFKKSKCLGMWRVSKFYSQSLPNEKNIIFHKKQNPLLKKNKIILFLGYYSHNNVEYPHLNKKANNEFIESVNFVAKANPMANVIVRFKSKMQKIKDIENNFEKNVFLCDDFCRFDLSYSLCKRADLIISCQTSLAEECIVYGKNVILIDNLFTVKNMIRCVYPKDFWFLIATNKNHLVKLTKQYFKNDKKIKTKIFKLKQKLGGQIDLSQKNSVSKAVCNEILRISS